MAWRDAVRQDPQRIVADGDEERGRLVGIAVRDTNDRPPVRVDEYAVLVGGRVLGIGQRLAPDDRVRLGMAVRVRVHRGRGVIDWAATMAEIGGTGTTDLARWRPLRRPPPVGITDRTRGIARPRPRAASACALVCRVVDRSTLIGLDPTVDLEVELTENGRARRIITLDRTVVPYYARHLCEVGRRLPAWVDPHPSTRVTIDWCQAARDVSRT